MNKSYYKMNMIEKVCYFILLIVPPISFCMEQTDKRDFKSIEFPYRGQDIQSIVRFDTEGLYLRTSGGNLKRLLYENDKWIPQDIILPSGVVTLWGPLFNKVNKLKKTWLDLILGRYSDTVSTFTPYVLQKNTTYEVRCRFFTNVKNDLFLYTHMHPVYKLYSMSLPGVSVVITGTVYPSIGVYKEAWTCENGNCQIERRAVAKWPGYLLIGVGDNTIVYTKIDPNESKLFYRLYRYVTGTSQTNALYKTLSSCDVYAHTIIDDEGDLMDLTKGRLIAQGIPTSYEHTWATAITDDTIAFFDGNDQLHVYVNGIKKEVQNTIFLSHKKIGDPFIVKADDKHSYLIWCTAVNEICIIDLSKPDPYIVRAFSLKLEEAETVITAHYDKKSKIITLITGKTAKIGTLIQSYFFKNMPLISLIDLLPHN